MDRDKRDMQPGRLRSSQLDSLSRVAKECESKHPFQEASDLAAIILRKLISARAATEPLTVLGRFDERSDHLGSTGARLRLRIVAHIFARLTH